MSPQAVMESTLPRCHGTHRGVVVWVLHATAALALLACRPPGEDGTQPDAQDTGDAAMDTPSDAPDTGDGDADVVSDTDSGASDTDGGDESGGDADADAGDAGDLPPTAVSTHALIQAALTAGDLDQDTALVYRVLGAFGDDRLPVAFRGDDRQVIDTNVGLELVARYDALSPAHQALVYPYTLPPPAEGSWWVLRNSGAGEWPSDAPSHLIPPPVCNDHFNDRKLWVPLDSDKFRVWYSDGGTIGDIEGQSAAMLLTVLEERIWDALTGLMQRDPVSDQGQPCNGGDGRLDIYALYRTRDYGSSLIMPMLGDCHQPRPVFVVIHAQRPSDDSFEVTLSATMAHEFMHVLQLAFAAAGECFDMLGGPIWVMEGTAVWAAEYVDPAWSDGHRLTESMMESARLGLSAEDAPDARYRSYSFWRHVTERHDDDSLIRQFFESFETSAHHGEGVGSVLPDGWADALANYALALWNRAPHDPWRQWLGIEREPAMAEVELVVDEGEVDIASLGPAALRSFGVGYWRILPGERLRLFVMNNPWFGQADAGIRVTAVLEYADGSLSEALDWSAVETPYLCRDQQGENFKALYLVVSWADGARVYDRLTPGGTAEVIGADMPCYRLTGSSTVTVTTSGTSGDLSSQGTEVTEALFEMNRTRVVAEDGTVGVQFEPSGTLDWHADLSVWAVDPPFSNTCPAGPVENQGILPDDGGLGLYLTREGQGFWFANGQTHIGPLAWTDCFGAAGAMESDPYWLYTGTEMRTLDTGDALSGSYDASAPSNGGTTRIESSWSLRAVVE